MTDRRPSPPPTFVPSGFFALRTPLLPFDVLVDWASAPPREHLRRWVEDPQVREALFLASPSLDESLPVWLSAPESERGRKVERTLVRYFARMAGRATPFGLFATHAMGRLGERTRLRLGARNTVRKHARLDMDYVCALVERARQAPEVRNALRYLPNTSLFRTPTHLRYLETRVRARGRRYHLVGVEMTPFLESTLTRAREGATLAALAEALVAQDASIPLPDAHHYMEVLVDAQVLLPTWAPPVTGAEPVPHLLAGARDIAALAPLRDTLTEVQARLGALHHEPITPPDTYREVARRLESLSVPVELPRLFQVDAQRPGGELSLSGRVTEEILAGVEALRRLTPRRDAGDALTRFRERFAQRYEHRPVPLLEALDEERGVGLRQEARPGASTSPLLQGLPFPTAEEREGPRWDARARLLLRRVEACWREGAHELVLTPRELEALEEEDSAVLPDGFGVMGTLVARSAEAVDQGDFRFVLEHAHGPSGVTLLGRFCHGSPELEAQVREHVAAEERLRPDAVFAEIVHLPQDRMGNVICRPTLRRHEIVFMGQSGVPLEEQLRVEDLWLSLEEGRLVLRSPRLGGREVIPRLSNAHAFGRQGVGVYRFLGLLQNQDQRGFGFQWGALAAATFLPRVSVGRTVLALARWNLRGALLREWRGLEDAERQEAFQRWRAQTRLPRWVCLKDGDNVLPLDLDNPLCLDTLLHTLKDRPGATLEELYPGPEELCVEDGQGRYVHELVVPFVRTRPFLPPRPQKAPAPVAPAPRRFPPGSEWLYLKLYTGTATADRLLRTVLADAVRRLEASGAVESWFFLRYADPEHHLRLRLHGAPERLDAEAWPALRRACASALEDGSVWRLQLDTYEREVERYGGPVGMTLCERVFHADSEAALACLEASAGDEGAELRWRLALKGMNLLLEGLGLTLDDKCAVATRLREGYSREFPSEGELEEQVGLRFRAERKGLEALLAADTAPEPLRPALEALARRGERLRPLGEALARAWSEGTLTLPPARLADSLLHLQANRFLTGEQRAQERVLYDFLERLYRSQKARMSSR